MSRFVEHGNKQRMGLLVFVWLLFLLYVLVCFLKIWFCCSKKECNPLSLAQTHCDWQVKEAARFYFRRPSFTVSMVTRSCRIYVCCHPFYILVNIWCFHYLSVPWHWIDVHLYIELIQPLWLRSSHRWKRTDALRLFSSSYSIVAC